MIMMRTLYPLCGALLLLAAAAQAGCGNGSRETPDASEDAADADGEAVDVSHEELEELPDIPDVADLTDAADTETATDLEADDTVSDFEGDDPSDDAYDAEDAEEEEGPPDYPSPPYGTSPGDRIANLQVTGTDGSPILLSDFYSDTSVKLLFVFRAAAWDAFSVDEAAWLQPMWEDYHPQGLEILGVLSEDDYGSPADASDALAFANAQGWEFPAGADETGVLDPYFGEDLFPSHMFVDLTDMTILLITVGYSSDAALRDLITYWLASIPDRT